MEIRRIKIFIASFCLLLFGFSTTSVYAGTLSKPANNLGLVGYLSFDEATGTVATDFSGNRNNGTLVNMAHPATAASGWSNGKFGKGLKFDGSNDYVSMDGVADNVVETSFSVSVWIKGAWTSGFHTVWGINGSTFSVNKTQVFIDSSNQIGLYDGTSDSTEITSSAVMGDGLWHHVVYTRSGSTGTMYVDGVSQGTHTGNDTFATNDLWSIGQEWDSGPVVSDLYSGSIDDFRVYNRVLGLTEILSLYNSRVIRTNTSFSQNNIVTSGLIGYWTMDGGTMTSTTAYDSSTSGNTLTMTNGPTKTIGKIGQSINLDAVDDELFCTDANCGGTTGGKYDMGTRDWTVMAWIKPENGATSCNISGRVVGKIGDDETQGWFIGIANSYICGSIRNGGVDIFSTLDGSQVTLNEWNHIAIIFDRDGNMTRYLNGVQTGTQDSISAYNGVSVDHPLNFCIGGRDGGAGCIERMFDGSVDEVRIYERVLTAGEIKQVYNAGVGTKVNTSQNVISGTTLQSGLIGMWSFNGLDVTDRVYDRSGQGNDAYHVGRATSTAKTIGKLGQAFDFDGTTDYVRIGNPSGLNNLGPLTYSVWVYPRTVGGGGRGHIISKTDPAGSSTGGMLLSMSNLITEAVNFLRITTASAISRTSAANSVPLNTWSHIVLTWDGSVDSNNVHIYINGTEGSYADTGTASGSVDSDSSNPFLIGIRGFLDRAFDGKIDEVRFYNRVLTASEAKQLYLMGR